MSSTSETGHAKNLSNFEALITFCSGYGSSYNPSRETLTIAGLKALLAGAKMSYQLAIITNESFNKATNDRRVAFKDLKTLSTKIVNALAVSGASDLTVNNARTINRKLQGTRASAANSKPTPTTDLTAPVPTTKTISSSQQSFDSIIEHFSKLIENISQEATYKPNEIELKTDTLKANLELLTNSNTAIMSGYTNWSNARIVRNSTLYGPLTGLVPVALAVKQYVKSLYSASSAQFNQVNGLEFKTRKD